MPPKTARSDVSENELQLRKLDHRDILMRIVQNVALFVVVAINLLTLMNMQQVIDQNQKSALDRSNQAARERAETKNYIKCVLLIRYDMPEGAVFTREQSSDALDKCAKSTESL
jgi:hypothetical protein